MERIREEAAKERKKHKKMRIEFDAMVQVAGLLTSAPARRNVEVYKDRGSWPYR